MGSNSLFQGRVQFFLALVVWILVGYVFNILIGRSIWVDEGMLLKNIADAKGLLSYFDPLPFYDQAQPMFASFIQYLFFHNVSMDIEILRIYTLAVSFLISFPVLYVFYKEKTGFLLPSVIFLAFSLSLGFYVTEIKHYAFEIAASFLMIAIFYLQTKEKLSFQVSIILIAMTTYIGFSTIIPAFFIISYLTVFNFLRSGKYFFEIKTILALLISLSIALITLSHMNNLTVYQISNFDAYDSKGLWGDLVNLIAIGVSSHGKALTLSVSLMVILLLFFNKKYFVFKLNIVFLLIVSFVCFGKLTGFYPVFSARHIIWIVPFSFVILVIGISHFVKSKDIVFKAVGLFALALSVLQSVNVVYKSASGISSESTENNQLYEELAQLKSADVMVYPHAKPTLEFYLKTIERLNKHNYIGFHDNVYVSSLKNPETSKERFFERIDSNFKSIPSEEFYYVISHLDYSLPDQDLPKSQSWRRDYLNAKLSDYNCSHSETYSGRRVSILRVFCRGMIE